MVFPHALRVDNVPPVSDSGFTLGRDRWRAALD
jgi:hypothetical protein